MHTKNLMNLIRSLTICSDNQGSWITEVWISEGLLYYFVEPYFLFFYGSPPWQRGDINRKKKLKGEKKKNEQKHEKEREKERRGKGGRNQENKIKGRKERRKAAERGRIKRGKKERWK